MIRVVTASRLTQNFCFTITFTFVFPQLVMLVLLTLSNSENCVLLTLIFSVDCRSHRLIILHCKDLFVIRRASSFSFYLLLNHRSFGEICHRRAYREIILLSLVLHPVVSCFQLNDAFFQYLFVSNQLLHFEVGVFPRILLQHLKSFSQIFIFVLKLVNFAVLVVY